MNIATNFCMTTTTQDTHIMFDTRFNGRTVQQVVTRVYSGRPGCMCGCKGKYSTNKSTMTRVANLIKTKIAEFGTASSYVDFGQNYVCAEINNRVYCVRFD